MDWTQIIMTTFARPMSILGPSPSPFPISHFHQDSVCPERGPTGWGLSNLLISWLPNSKFYDTKALNPPVLLGLLFWATQEHPRPAASLSALRYVLEQCANDLYPQCLEGEAFCFHSLSFSFVVHCFSLFNTDAAAVEGRQESHTHLPCSFRSQPLQRFTSSHHDLGRTLGPAAHHFRCSINMDKLDCQRGGRAIHFHHTQPIDGQPRRGPHLLTPGCYSSLSCILNNTCHLSSERPSSRDGVPVGQ